MWDNRPAVTANGYLSVVLQGAQPEDVVDIVFGCNFLLLPRPKGNMFQFVAECYVQGMIGTEIADLIHDEDGPFQL